MVTFFILITHNPFIQNSASANRWLTLIEGLSKLGVYFKLIVYGGYQSEEEAMTWSSIGEKNGIHFKYIAPKIVKGYLKKRFQTYIGDELRKPYLKRLILREVEPHHGIIWTDSSYFGFQLATEIKKRYRNTVLILEMSEFLDIHKYNKGNFLQKWKSNQRLSFFENKAFHVYDGLALMTRTLINHYQKFQAPQPKILHLPMTVDLERFQGESIQPKEFVKPYIAFVGVMDNAKDGVDILVKSFCKIYYEFPNYKLYLIGSWNYDTPNHLKMINELGLSSQVFWMKEYPRDAIPAIIKNADLLVLPRPDSKQAQGGFPTKLGEYLATGNPVCATTVGEIPEYLVDEESVFFAKPGSVESFAEAMRRALSNPAAAKRVGANGHKVAETHFNKDIQAKKLYDFLSDLTQKSSNNP